MMNPSNFTRFCPDTGLSISAKFPAKFGPDSARCWESTDLGHIWRTIGQMWAAATRIIPERVLSACRVVLPVGIVRRGGRFGGPEPPWGAVRRAGWAGSGADVLRPLGLEACARFPRKRAPPSRPAFARAMSFKNDIVVDCRGHLLGRLCSIIGKEILG